MFKLKIYISQRKTEYRKTDSQMPCTSYVYSEKVSEIFEN